jgi:hypothetical protein
VGREAVHPLAFLNAFLQVWVVSVAEVVVCWGLVGGTLFVALRAWCFSSPGLD